MTALTKAQAIAVVKAHHANNTIDLCTADKAIKAVSEPMYYGNKMQGKARASVLVHRFGLDII